MWKQFFLLGFVNGSTLDAVQKHLSKKMLATSKILLVNYCFPSTSNIHFYTHVVSFLLTGPAFPVELWVLLASCSAWLKCAHVIVTLAGTQPEA